MRLVTRLVVLALAAFSPVAVHAEEIVFVGKTYSPNHVEIFSPHAAPGASVPFTGKMKVTRVLADIGQRVDTEQHLLEFAFPPEDLIAEKRRLSQADLKLLEVTLDRVRAEMTHIRKDLDEARMRQSSGSASSQELSDLARNLQLAKMKEQALDYSLGLERELTKGNLDLAKTKFGSKASEHNLSGASWITSPVAGYVLWSNPEVKQGMILSKRTKLFVVGSLDPILIRALIYETQVPKLRAGDKAQVTFEALPGKTFEATLVRTPMSGFQSEMQLPNNFEVELTMPNPDLTLKEGMRGQVKIQVPDGPR